MTRSSRSWSSSCAVSSASVRRMEPEFDGSGQFSDSNHRTCLFFTLVSVRWFGETTNGLFIFYSFIICTCLALRLLLSADRRPGQGAAISYDVPID